MPLVSEVNLLINMAHTDTKFLVQLDGNQHYITLQNDQQIRLKITLRAISFHELNSGRIAFFDSLLISRGNILYI